MDVEKFEEQLGRLINRARCAEQIPLHQIIDLLNDAQTGLEMAHNEGEEW